MRIKIEDRVQALRKGRMEQGLAVPESYQGISKLRIIDVMRRVGYGDKLEIVDAVFALLDDETPSWYSNAPADATFSSGASTAHVMSHVGILQRGQGKIDRERRDYIFKPLEELGALEKVTLTGDGFLPGHLTAKSANSAYRLDPTFVALLKTAESDLVTALADWVGEDQHRRRRERHAASEVLARQHVGGSKHGQLIQAVVELYVPQFHAGFEVLYIDDGDGQRITDEQRLRMEDAGIVLTLADAMPDVLLYDFATGALWVVEAVTSDGEVDSHKVAQLRALAHRVGARQIGFTTAYPNWKKAAERQDAHHNLAAQTYVWVSNDPARRLRVEGSV